MEDIELLDLFAMTTLHGHLSNPNLKRITYEELAEYSYDLAEAMMQARDTHGQD
jgi:hypothetical protein